MKLTADESKMMDQVCSTKTCFNYSTNGNVYCHRCMHGSDIPVREDIKRLKLKVNKAIEKGEKVEYADYD